MSHPRDRFLTVFGRKPVLEVLEDRSLPVHHVLVAKEARGPAVAAIVGAAKARGVRLERRSAQEISRLSRRPKQDQGVVADVEAPRMNALEDWLQERDPEAPAQLLALDRVTTPANVGMILRSATVLGLDGVVLPRRGCPEVGPLVLKASAGVAFRAPILRCPALPEALLDLAAAGFDTLGLADGATDELASMPIPSRAVWVLGNETEGIGEDVSPLLRRRVRIPMAREGDSLNVACAATVVAYAVTAAR